MGEPQGSVLSTLLINIMLYDFMTPSPPSTGKHPYTDDITVNVRVKFSSHAEVFLHHFWKTSDFGD